MAIDGGLKHHNDIVRSSHLKQHGSNAEYLLGFLATHECFSLFVLHMPMALQKIIVQKIIVNFCQKKKAGQHWVPDLEIIMVAGHIMY